MKLIRFLCYFGIAYLWPLIDKNVSIVQTFIMIGVLAVQCLLGGIQIDQSLEETKNA